MRRVARFKYILDPLFLSSLALYTVNKIPFLRPHWLDWKFCNWYLNDMLLVPVLLPVILFFSKICNFRKEDAPPKPTEIAVALATWVIGLEVVGPVYFGKGTSDPLDALAYCLGAFFSWIIWNRQGPFSGSNKRAKERWLC